MLSLQEWLNIISTVKEKWKVRNQHCKNKKNEEKFVWNKKWEETGKWELLWLDLHDFPQKVLCEKCKYPFVVFFFFFISFSLWFLTLSLLSTLCIIFFSLFWSYWVYLVCIHFSLISFTQIHAFVTSHLPFILYVRITLLLAFSFSSGYIHIWKRKLKQVKRL